MTITRKNPVREAFSGCSTGNIPGPYYESKGRALRAFDRALGEYDLCLDQDGLVDFTGNEGSKVVAIHDESGDVTGHARFSWYRMPSGRYEFIGYIA